MPGNSAGYSLAPVASDETAKEGRKTYEVRLARKTGGPVEVQFNARTPYSREAGGRRRAGVRWRPTRSWGRRGNRCVVVAAGRPWQVTFGPMDQIRQIERPPDLPRAEGVLTAFEYYAQPCRLPVSVEEAKSRVSVEPEFRILVDADRVTLKGKLKYRVRGGDTDSLAAGTARLATRRRRPGRPDRLRQGDRAVGDGFAAAGAASVRSDGGDDPGEPQGPGGGGAAGPGTAASAGRSSSPATVAILPADTVELTPAAKGMIGLTPQQAAPSMDLSARSGQPPARAALLPGRSRQGGLRGRVSRLPADDRRGRHHASSFRRAGGAGPRDPRLHDCPRAAGPVNARRAAKPGRAEADRGPRVRRQPAAYAGRACPTQAIRAPRARPFGSCCGCRRDASGCARW